MLLLTQCGPSAQLAVQNSEPPLTPTVTSTPFEEKVESSPTKTRILATKAASITPTLSSPTITATPLVTNSTVVSGDPVGQIAFESERDGNDEIYVMDLVTREERRLTNHPSLDSSPVWSPDGKLLAFSTNRDGNFEIYTMKGDGSQLVRLTDHPAADDQPTWSPDGKELAFVSNRDGEPDIYVMNVDGTDVERLTTHSGADSEPNWSSNGKTIFFTSERDEAGTAAYPALELYMMNKDGSNQHRLTNKAAFNHSPTNSPDGRFIAFASNLHGDRLSKIYIMASESGLPRRLTREGTVEVFIESEMAGEFAPTWSFDGQFIAFTVSNGKTSQIYLVDIEGTQIIQLTDGEASNAFPAWRPRSE